MIVPPTLHGLLYVAHNMREWDRREIMATRWTDSPEQLAVDCWSARNTAWMAVAGDRPAAVVGAIERWPGSWSVWMFATDEFPKVGLSMTRLVVRNIIPGLRGAGARRADCMSMDGHTAAHRWLETLGARRHLQPFTRYGKDGETFWQFYWE